MKTSTYVFRKILFCVLCLTGPCLGIAQQVEKGLTASNGKHVGFLEYKPADYAYSSTKYPVIIFYHGIGERGNGTTDLYKVKRNGIPRYIDRGNKMRFYWNGKWESFIVLTPQLDGSYGNWQNFYGEALVAYAKKNLRIDTNRIFMAGLSLGGGGVWSYASGSLQNAQALAAIAPACGVCTISNACNIAKSNLPVWAEHAADDPTVGVSCTINSISKIKACNPAVEPIKVIYPTGGHAIWDRTFDTAWKWHDVNIYEWFLGQNKSLRPNVLPEARITGNNIISTTTGSTTLSAATSTDADGKLVRYIWRQLSGPAAANILAAKQVSTDITGLTTSGNYQFEITVVDNRANWTKDTIRITASSTAPPNIAPVANAGIDITIAQPSNSITLDGTSSSDPDGTISTSTWSQVSGPSPATIARSGSLATDISDLQEGTYSFRLTVTDNDGLSHSDIVNVIVLPIPNELPFVDAGSNVVLYLPEDSVTISGVAHDNDGSIVSYKWQQTGGPSQALLINPNQSETEIRNLENGIYFFALRAVDDLGGESSDTMLLTVKNTVNQAPRITVSKTLTVQLPEDSAAITGEGSFDPDGNIINYEWLKISGPNSFEIVHPDSISTLITGLTVGTYMFTLTITDNQRETTTDTVKIKVLPPLNQPPVAIAGINILLNLPSTDTTIDGSASSDPEGDAITYEWRKLKGPSGDLIVSSSSAITGLSGLQEGMYVYELKVTDPQGALGLDTVRVTVKGLANVPPDVDGGSDKTIVVTAPSVTLDATASHDADGSIVSYQWNLLSGPSGATLIDANVSIASLKGFQVGDYLLEIIATDNDGAIGADTIAVHVLPNPIIPPVAVAGTDLVVTLPVDSIMLVSNGSFDADGVIVKYAWKMLSGPNQPILSNTNTPTANFTNAVEGTYIFQLVVTDDDGVTGKDQIEVTVLPKGNTKPIADAGNDRTHTLPLSQVALDGTGSYDPDGHTVQYFWTQVGGPSNVNFIRNDLVKASLTDVVPGVYTFRLTIVDEGGLQSADDVKITILKAPNKLPVANAGTDQQAVPGDAFTLNGTASYDPDGNIAKYNWIKISGAGGLTIVNSNAATPSVVGTIAGTYVFQLTVIDNEGAEASADVTITVKSRVNKAPVADAGTDTVIVLPSSEIELDASGSLDIDGSIVTYEWNQLSGPQDAEIINNNGGFTAVTGIEPGVYVFELTVQDNDGAVSRDTVAVKVVSNLRPINNVLAYPNPAVGNVTLRITTIETGYTSFTVYDLYGRVIINSFADKVSPEMQYTIPVNGLKAGLYVIEINISDKKKMITRLVKQ